MHAGRRLRRRLTTCRARRYEERMGRFKRASVGLAVVLLGGCSSPQGDSVNADSGAPPSEASTGKYGVDSVDVETLTRAIVAMNSCTVDDGVLRTETYLRGKQGGYQYPPLDFGCLARV